jgi:hypothetical protein
MNDKPHLLGWKLSLLALAFIVACSDKTPSNPDTRVPDGPRSERPGDGVGPTGEGRPASDRGPDVSVKRDTVKQPARWEVVSGAELKFEGHTATLLQDGRVLVAGGRTSGPTATREALLYDPGKNTMQQTGSMAKERWAHTATLLQDGRVLVAGGNAPGSAGALDSTEVFDPASPASPWSTGPSLPGRRSSHRAVLLASGEVLLSGGLGGSGQLNSLALYQPGTNNWKQLGIPMTSKRVGHTATVLKNGKVLFAGGYSGQDYLDTLEVFDPATETMTPIAAKLTEKRNYATASLLQAGQVLIVGGEFCGGSGCQGTVGDDLYDPSTNQVTGIAHAGSPPVFHAAASLSDGRVLITGGTGSGDSKKAVLYSPGGAGSWSSAPLMASGRYSHTATTLSDGSVLVVGGTDQQWTYVGDVERFYP